MRSGPEQRSRGRYQGNRLPQRQQGSPQRSQTFDSNGPGVRVRGNAPQIYERYIALAREAAASEDRISAENFYQHAEHYFRVMKAANEGHQQRATRPSAPTDLQTEMSEEEGSEIDGPARASPSQRQPYYPAAPLSS